MDAEQLDVPYLVGILRALGAQRFDHDGLLQMCIRDSMYTTWENKYKLLPGFGDMVSKRQ